MDINETECKGMNWIQNSVQWQDLGNTEMNIRFHKVVECFFPLELLLAPQ